MKLAPRQIESHLRRGLAPVYLLSGDEPLQMMETADAIRRAAIAQGFSERQVMHAEAGFDWSGLQGEAAALSLFAQRKVIDLRLRGRPGREGGKALADYAKNPPPDNILLVQSAKLDKGARSSTWVKALERAGVHIQIWELSPPETLKLVGERLRQAGFQPEPEAVKLLTERVEGNLLAAVQEIEKLRLIRDPGPLSAETVLAAVSNSARYDPFELVDAALLQDARRVIRIVHGLRAEAVAESQVLWALSRDIRLLCDYADTQQAGHDPGAVLNSVWPKRRGLLVKAARHYPPAVWRQLLQHCVEIDRQIKGLAQGNAWDELLHLALRLAGQSTLLPG